MAVSVCDEADEHEEAERPWACSLRTRTACWESTYGAAIAHTQSVAAQRGQVTGRARGVGAGTQGAGGGGTGTWTGAHGAGAGTCAGTCAGTGGEVRGVLHRADGARPDGASFRLSRWGCSVGEVGSDSECVGLCVPKRTARRSSGRTWSATRFESDPCSLSLLHREYRHSGIRLASAADFNSYVFRRSSSRTSTRRPCRRTSSRSTLTTLSTPTSRIYRPCSPCRRNSSSRCKTVMCRDKDRAMGMTARLCVVSQLRRIYCKWH